MEFVSQKETANVCWSESIEQTFFVFGRNGKASIVADQGGHSAGCGQHGLGICATMGLQSPKLFAEIEIHSAWLVKDGKPQEVTKTAWACATMGLQSPKLFAEIEARSAWFIKEGNPQEVANTAWACATMGLHSPRLFAKIEQFLLD
jgi:hypothetical protein